MDVDVLAMPSRICITTYLQLGGLSPTAAIAIQLPKTDVEVIATHENDRKYAHLNRVLCAHTAPHTLRRLTVEQTLEIFLQSGRMKVELCLRRVSLVARDGINSAGRILSHQDGTNGHLQLLQCRKSPFVVEDD